MSLIPTPTSGAKTLTSLGVATLSDAHRLHRRTEARCGVTVTTLREIGISPGVSEAGRDLYVATVGTGEKHVWLQGRIHGNEPYGVDTLLTLLSAGGSNGAAGYRAIREGLTLHGIPMYNPDGTELNIRQTVLQDGTERRIDLNWAASTRPGTRTRGSSSRPPATRARAASGRRRAARRSARTSSARASSWRGWRRVGVEHGPDDLARADPARRLHRLPQRRQRDHHPWPTRPPL